MKVSSASFGKKGKYKVGDLVIWSEIHRKMSGVVEKLYIANVGGRQVAYATIFEFKNQRKYEVLCINLKKMMKFVVSNAEN